MNLKETKLEGVYLMGPVEWGNDSGWCTELWTKRESHGEKSCFEYVKEKNYLPDGKEDYRNHHIQSDILSNSNLVRCTKGKVMDIIIDCRECSTTNGMWMSEELSEENKMQLLIPKGFAHRFLALTDTVEFQYKVNE